MDLKLFWVIQIACTIFCFNSSNRVQPDPCKTYIELFHASIIHWVLAKNYHKNQITKNYTINNIYTIAKSTIVHCRVGVCGCEKYIHMF